ncbi:MAG: HAMP domain-containing protein [Ignavibacteriae bacterium]|nr:MAG: HAMP domain-containing protein [Ignavibacteriota bacterium]
MIISFWIVRFFWRELNFPSALINGWIFNPNLYASPFIFGFTSSLGELILTILTAALSGWFLLSRIAWNTESERPFTNRNMRGRIGSTAFVLFSSLLLLWFFRGFGEVVRSIIFDSTIRFNNPAEFLPDGNAALMYFNIILLGASLLGISTLVFLTGRKILANHFNLETTRLRMVHYGIVLLSIPLFAFIDDTRFIPLVCSTIFTAVCLFFMEVMSYWKSMGCEDASHRWKLVLWMMVASFVIGAPLIHQELQQRERREVEAVENVYLRPSDSWLTYVVQAGLRSSVESFAANRDSYSFAVARENNLAFVLWAKTLMGKEGYNSGLILYNPQGNEVDQFIVGMNKPEQQNILTNVFAGEEEAVHVVNQADPRTLGKLYGAWTTIRDSSGQLLGSIALVLSEHQKGIFHGEDSEPLRQFGDLLENNSAREIAVHEFIRDSLVFSTGRKLYPERLLSAAIDSELQTTKNPYLWKDLSINGYRTNTVFSKDPALPERIAAISLEELDFRWDLFGTIKVFFICLAVLILLGIGLALQKVLQKEIPAMGFRGKLLSGFACITMIPLVILSYYNKELVSDRVQMQGAALLYDDLSKLEDRISAYVSDEEDFVKGIDDDFCEALAAEYGIDFSIYRGGSIQASSRPELYRASLLDGRLNGGVYSSTVLDGKTQVLAKEKIGSVEYVVGYTPFFMNGRAVGVIAVPTLKREKEIEAELAQQNAYVFSMYAIIFGIALAGGGFLALRFARPLQSLTAAAKNVAEGNLDITVPATSQDEIGVLAQSFNDMILKLRASREELAKHERENAWKEMAKQVAHEIKNPLTPMKLSMQHLRQAFKDHAPGREEILQRVTQTVIDQIEALSRIASEFSNYAKMPEGRYERINIDQLLNETINLFREVEGITFINHLASPTLSVIADHEQLLGVFINIIRNAIQAIEKTGSITLKTSKEGRWCVVLITDTGHGIPEEIRSKIFEPNFSTKSEGMGIGLAIARRVVEDHGGRITCYSEGGTGTSFEIKLPV